MERRQVGRLASLGLQPARSAIFVGPPGVGKTLTARWLAAQLQLPLYVLDLTAGHEQPARTQRQQFAGCPRFRENIGHVFCCWNEIDSVAKRRNDDSDCRRIKTSRNGHSCRRWMLGRQQAFFWPQQSSRADRPALWRRFDLTIEFKAPSADAIKLAITQFLGSDQTLFEQW